MQFPEQYVSQWSADVVMLICMQWLQRICDVNDLVMITKWQCDRCQLMGDVTGKWSENASLEASQYVWRSRHNYCNSRTVMLSRSKNVLNGHRNLHSIISQLWAEARTNDSPRLVAQDGRNKGRTRQRTPVKRDTRRSKCSSKWCRCKFSSDG